MPKKQLLKKIRRTTIVFLSIVLLLAIYVEIANRNTSRMTYRQKLLKAFYPAWMWWSRATGINVKELSGSTTPPVPFYSLRGTLNNGTEYDFGTLKGKKVLLVNTASNCGYTNQYEDLQKLSEEFSGRLVVIGFPANDFKEQEKGSDEEIAGFCKINFGVTFPLMKKSIVIKSPGQHPVFQWLTDSTKNGWNNEPPSWNFTKYLVSEDGKLSNYFGPSISPRSKDVLEAIKK
jgi:glutathione peroxidase